MLYSGQYGGFTLAELEQTVHAIENMPGVEVGGVCSFPCFLYDEAAGDILPTPNLSTVQTAARMLTAWGYKDLMRNTPSATCVHSIPKIAAAGGTHGEPGHGLTGTTPYHAAHPDAEERPGYLYISEVSHDLGTKSYCYGGGHYRRGHMKNALVGTTLEDAKIVPVLPPDDSSIDYHLNCSRTVRCRLRRSWRSGHSFCDPQPGGGGKGTVRGKTRAGRALLRTGRPGSGIMGKDVFFIWESLL